MNIALYTDNSLSIPLDGLVRGLNKLSTSIRFNKGKERFHLRDSAILHPSTYEQLPKQLTDEFAHCDMPVLATMVPYDNNFFFEGHNNAVIVSFFGWNQLTDLPITNGLVYFVASMVVNQLGIGKTHEQNIGCINDFWWDKRGVNAGMRAAFICADCLASFSGNSRGLKDVEALLDCLSRASRTGRDIMDFLTSDTIQRDQPFDVFLCHNSQDKPTVREINSHFKQAGLATWMDEEQLPLGRPWQVEIEKRISDIRAAAVFVGDNGIGPWHEQEIRAFLSEFVQRGIPVIPVILPTATNVPELPIFLRAMTWVDLRRDKKKALARLVEAIQTHKGI